MTILVFWIAACWAYHVLPAWPSIAIGVAVATGFNRLTHELIRWRRANP